MKRLITFAATTALLVGGCGGSSGDKTAVTKSGAGVTTTSVDRVLLAKDCSTTSFAAATKPVRITYWHSQSQSNLTELQHITTEFNTSQSDVFVTLQDQGGADETLTKYKNVAGTSDAPDLLQLNETSLQTMIDSKAIIPAQACIDATKADLSDVLPRVHDYYTVAGATWAMPFNVSQPVLLFNKTAFRNAGLDPEKPPTDFATLSQIAAVLKSKGGVKFGFQYKRDSWVLEQFLALAGEPYVDHNNGRSGRAATAVFDTPVAVKVLTSLQSLVKQGIATTNAADGPEGFSNLIGICNGDNAMTIDSSAVLATAYDTLAKGQCKVKVDVGVAPLPLPSGANLGGTLVGGGANFIARPAVGDTASPKVLAAFKFAQYLTTAKIQAEWAAGTGYIPISKGAASEPALTAVWAAKPGYKVAYDELANGVQNTATAEPLIGAYKDVRTAMKTALESLFLDKVDPKRVLQLAIAGANKAISDYNAANQ